MEKSSDGNLHPDDLTDVDDDPFTDLEDNPEDSQAAGPAGEDDATSGARCAPGGNKPAELPKP